MPQYVPDNPEYHVSSSSTNDLLSNVISDRIDHLYTSINQSNQLLQKRTELRNNHQLEISKQHVRIQNLLFDFENKGKDISSLEVSLANLSQEQRQQELSHWRDTAELMRELKKSEKELRSAILDLWMIQFLS